MPDYGKIVKRSIEIVKKNKWLLVYGALVAAGSGGGGSGRSGSGSSNGLKDLEKLKHQNIPGDIPQKTSMVLGQFTSAVREWFFSVSPITWVLISLGLIMAIVIAIIFGMILRNWAKGALIAGVQLALQDKEVNLTNTSPLGKAKVKNLIIFSLITTGLFLGLLIILPSFWLIVFFLLKNISGLKTFWEVLGIIAGIIIFLVSMVFLSMVSIYAERLIVLNDEPPWDAWKKGLSLSKHNFLSTAVMGIVNAISTSVFGCLTTIVTLIILGIPSFVLIAPFISQKRFPPLYVYLFLALFLFILVAIMSLLKAVTEVFKYSNWNQIFDEVTSDTKKGLIT